MKNLQCKKSIYLELLMKAVVFIVVIFAFIPITNAGPTDPPSVILTINNGSSATVLDGQSVTLRYVIDGAVSNCQITPGNPDPIAIDTSILPTDGTIEVVPPSGDSTTYVLSCDGASDEGTVHISPTVELSASAINYTTDPVTGQVKEKVIISWSASDATVCSNMSYQMDPSNNITEVVTPWGVIGKNTLNGSVEFSPNVNRALTGTTTFFINCTNTSNDEVANDEITVNVTTSGPPPPVEVNVETATPNLQKSLLYGQAYATVSWEADNASLCYLSASYADLTPYDTNPTNWSSDPRTFSKTITNIPIVFTTDFTVTCTRPAVTSGGVTYPTDSQSDTVRVVVTNPPGVPDNNEDWVRIGEGYPPVTAYLSADPAVAEKDPSTSQALTTIRLEASNADYCFAIAYYTNDTPLDYTDDERYYLFNWSTGGTNDYIKNKALDGDGVWEIDIKLTSDTRFTVDCQREYDVVYGDAAEIANGQATTSVVVEVQDSTASLAPVAHMLGHSVSYTPQKIVDNATEIIGFAVRTINGYGPQLVNYASAVNGSASLNQAKFNFEHPLGVGKRDDFNFYINACDLQSGQSTYRILVNGTPIGSDYITDNAPNNNSFCTGSSNRLYEIATDVNMVHGDEITIQCGTATKQFEGCAIRSLEIGVEGEITVNKLNPNNNLTNVTVGWVGENVTECEQIDIEYDNGDTQYWGGAPNGRYGGPYTLQLTGSSTITIECSRPGGDGATDSSELRIVVPGPEAITSEIPIVSGVCFDIETGGLLSPAPYGYAAGPPGSETFTGFCIPGLDLAADPQYISTNDPAPQFGVWVNGDVNFHIVNVLHEEIGRIDVPEAVSLSYRVDIGSDPEVRDTYKDYPQYAGLLPEDTISSEVAYHNDSIGLSPASSALQSVAFEDLMFGNNVPVCVRVNLDGSPENFPEYEDYLGNSHLDNNEECDTFLVPIPEPPMDLNLSTDLVRRNESVTVSWEVDVMYDLDCTVRGPGGLNERFKTLIEEDGLTPVGPGYTGSTEATNLQSSGIFSLTCSETATGHTFDPIEKEIEVIPNYTEF